MDILLNNVCDQVKNLTIDRETVKKLNGFFMDVNTLIKGSDHTAISVFIDQYGTLTTNLLRDDLDKTTPLRFKLHLIEYIQGFQDDKELLFDVIMTLDSHGLFKVTRSVKLHLFRVIFDSGYYGYNPVDSQDFKDSWDYIKFDLELIANTVNQETLSQVDDYLTVTLYDLYLFEGVHLQDIIL